MSRSNYRKIINFGHVAPKNPLEMCLGSTMNTKFEGGVLGDVLGSQQSENCQLLLAEYCGANWDGYCELASHNINKSLPNLVPGGALSGINTLKAGENLIRNAAVKRFGTPQTPVQRCQPFDPTNPNSPQVCYPINTGSFVSGAHDIQYSVQSYHDLNKDPLFVKMLETPHACMDILQGIYQHAQHTGQLNSLMDTHFGKFYAMNSIHFK